LVTVLVNVPNPRIQYQQYEALKGFSLPHKYIVLRANFPYTGRFTAESHFDNFVYITTKVSTYLHTT
jgi:hypothetical protein